MERDVGQQGHHTSAPLPTSVGGASSVASHKDNELMNSSSSSSIRSLDVEKLVDEDDSEVEPYMQELLHCSHRMHRRDLTVSAYHHHWNMMNEYDAHGHHLWSSSSSSSSSSSWEDMIMTATATAAAAAAMLVLLHDDDDESIAVESNAGNAAGMMVDDEDNGDYDSADNVSSSDDTCKDQCIVRRYCPHDRCGNCHSTRGDARSPCVTCGLAARPAVTAATTTPQLVFPDFGVITTTTGAVTNFTKKRKPAECE